ncbi:MAG: DUF3995 domain-containing protein [Actinocatenispora sp.]
MTSDPTVSLVVRHDTRAFNGDRNHLLLVRLSVAAGLWALWYALYRGYYAAGGTAFLPGTIRPGSRDQFLLINLIGALVIGAAAVVPVAMLPFWSRRWSRRPLLALCWAVAVGCCMHAIVDIAERVLSLAGVLTVSYPAMWASVDHRAADLQDLFFNEPWFLVEGLAFAALGWLGLGGGRSRRWWTATALAAVAALIVLWILTATGVFGKVIVF